MSIVAVDLAAKYSAATHMDDDGTVLDQWDSWGRSEADFIVDITGPWFARLTRTPEILVVEDLPHRLPFSSLVKRVCRLQGRIVQEMHALGCYESQVLFVPPAEWRKTYDGMKKGTGPDVVVPVSQRYGYTPPDLTERAKVKGGRAIARKVATDYCAAFLIGRWTLAMKEQHGTYDVLGTSRYGQNPIKKIDTEDVSQVNA